MTQNPQRDEKINRRLERQFDRIERAIPDWLARTLKFLRQPAARLIRVPLGILLVIGGIFSFLPVLGIWMLPLGLLFLAVDLNLLRGPVTRAVTRIETFLRARRRAKARKQD
ncbi:MAG: hypothetical protein H6873_09815 [Hyphomicrobiaceae bacterium]|nr:hypothetical protein [Hyphomicrobiaceae bacterium]